MSALTFTAAAAVAAADVFDLAAFQEPATAYHPAYRLADVSGDSLPAALQDLAAHGVRRAGVAGPVPEFIADPGVAVFALDADMETAPLLAGCGIGCTPEQMLRRARAAWFEGTAPRFFADYAPAGMPLRLETSALGPDSPLWPHMAAVHAAVARLTFAAAWGNAREDALALETEGEGLRSGVRADGDELLALLENGGGHPGTVRIEMPKAHAYALCVWTGAATRLRETEGLLEIRLEGRESMLILFTDREADAPVAPEPMDEALPLDGFLLVRPVRRLEPAGEGVHPVELNEAPVPFGDPGNPGDWPAGSFAGEVEYTTRFWVPMSWTDAPLRLEVERVEYAAAVYIDGEPAGVLLEPPWRHAIAPLEPGAHTMTVRVANTPAAAAVPLLARDAKGDPEQESALIAAMHGASGGLYGPVLIRRMTRDSAGEQPPPVQRE
jgi:hypothetical protein